MSVFPLATLCTASTMPIAPPVDVHGGLTYSAHCDHSPDPSIGICHVPAPGEPDAIWWLGFDCCHYMDAWGMSQGEEWTGVDGVYRDLAYVKGQCTGLAGQLEGLRP